jgi:hypothetical protein
MQRHRGMRDVAWSNSAYRSLAPCPATQRDPPHATRARRLSPALLSSPPLQADGVARDVFVGAVHATAPLRDFIKLHLVPPAPLHEEEGGEEEIFNSLLAVVTGRHQACLMRLWQRLAGDSPALLVGHWACWAACRCRCCSYGCGLRSVLLSLD